MFKACCTVAVVCVALSGTAVADILHVPGDYRTIQEAIDAAMDGDEVQVHSGTYNEAINFLGKAITVRSSDGPQVTIIDAQQTGTVVTYYSGEGPDTVLEGFTVTGGTGTDLFGGGDFVGGGMLNLFSNPTVANCTFSGNTAAFGGGMYNSGGSPTVTNCTFSGNTASGFVSRGGGMYNSVSNPTVTNCTFSGNTADYGGGMYNSSSNPTVTNCTFSGNAASAGGGGMFNFLNSSPTVTNCTFSSNTAGSGGGMLNSGSSNPTVTNCSFSGNTTTFLGGGMYNSNGSSPTVTNCTFSGNSAGYGGGMRNSSSSNPTVTNCSFGGNTATFGGGGISNYFASNPTVANCTFSDNTADFGGGMFNSVSSDPTVTNCTFSGNSAFTSGGGMRNSNSNPTVTNCSFSGNTATSFGAGIFNDSGDPTISNCTFTQNEAVTGAAIFNQSSASNPAIQNSIIWGNTNIMGTSISGPGVPALLVFSDVEGGFPGTGNIDADPLFVDPDKGDYRLSSGSPCADAGNNWGVPIDESDYDQDGDTAELFPVDLDGNPRFNADELDFDPGCGVPVVVDMGAYEYQFNPVEEVIFADLNADGAVGILDLLAVLAASGDARNNCLADLDIDGDVGIFDLLTLLANWG